VAVRDEREAARAAALRVHRGALPESRGTVYVGLVTRTIAFALDAALINTVAIVVGAVLALVYSVLPGSDPLPPALAVAGGAVFVAWVIGYFVAFWTTTGETPGNRLMRIRVERDDGTRLRPRHAALRLVGIVLSLPLFVGFVPILLNERRRGLHDALAGTVVVASRREGAAGA
jgi:uncharacterized RDD family membrane protein YckC